MPFPFSERSSRTLRYWRWLLLACVCGVCVGLALLTVRHWRAGAVALQADGNVMSLRGFHAVLHQKNVELHIAGDSLVIAPLKLVGPFRLGILHSLTVRKVTFETFVPRTSRLQSAMPEATLARVLETLPSFLDRFLAAVVPEQVPVALAHATGGPLTVIRHEDGRTTVVFTATMCRSGIGSMKVVCQEGKIHAQEQTAAFRELSFGDRGWQLLTLSGQKRTAPTWEGLFLD
jgi:hypothetical protein